MLSNCFVIACFLVSATVATEDTPNSCFASGDVHYYTFDGARSIDVQGSCMHTMGRPCCANSCQNGNTKPCPNKVLNDFHVMVQHVKESTVATVSYVGYVVVELCGCTVVMRTFPHANEDNGEVQEPARYSIVCGRHVDANRKFDYIEEEKVPYDERNFTCSTSGLTEASWFTIRGGCPDAECILLTTSYGVEIRHSYRHVQLTVPDEYKSRMCGICGNLDGNPDNDYKTKDGLNARSQADRAIKAPGSIGDFKVGNSWHVHNCDSIKCQLQTTIPRKREIRATGDAAKCLAWMKESCPNAVDNAVLTKCKVYMRTVNKECIRCRAGGKNCKCDAYKKQVESAIKSGATRSCPPDIVRDKCLEVMRKDCPDDNARVLRECMVDTDAVAADAKKCASRGGGCDTASWTRGNEAAVTSNAKAMCGRA